MDSNLRTLERTDRPRWLVECHRRGVPVLYKLGDVVSPVLPHGRYPGRWRIIGAEPPTVEFGGLPARFVLQSVDWGTQMQWVRVVPYGC